MDLKKLKEDVCRANLILVKYNLIISTWGNASGIDREKGLVAIKPSGVSYDELTPEKIVLVDLDGKVADGSKLRPSSDTMTHVELYKAWPKIGGIVHTHSSYATIFAQACMPIPCFGTTHADFCHGPVPCMRALTPAEVDEAYELHTGKVIVSTFAAAGMNPVEIPAAILSHHGPFTWGKDAMAAADNAQILEEVANMAWHTQLLSPGVKPAPDYITEKHHLRKHGPGAYYGQK